MGLCATFSFLLLCSCVVLGQDLFQGFFRQGEPCFETVKTGCNKSLSESFTPKSPNVVNIEPRTFVFLFTPKSPDVAESLHECGGSLPPESTYDPTANTEIFIHGWLDGVCRTAWMRECKEQVFQRAHDTNTPYNVILVDWTWGNTPDYLVAADNCKIVGEQIGFVINNIIRQTGATAEQFHVVGHSFGAIAAGFTGRGVRGLRRITALDPSIAPFKDYPPDQRVTYRDARIVDVIHSNSYDCFAIGNGDNRLLGHADFYPNGGLIQKSCKPYILTSFVKGDLFYALASLEPRVCSHLQSIQYYKISINPNGCEFVGVASSSYNEFLAQSATMSNAEWAVMGMDYELYNQSDGKRQKYYLTTKKFCPYYDNSYLGNKQFPFKTDCDD